MQEIKNKLNTLRDSLTEDSFNIDEFLIDIHEIDEQASDIDIYSKFSYIIEVDEVSNFGFEDDILDYASTIEDSQYVDIELYEELNYKDIVNRLDVIISTL